MRWNYNPSFEDDEDGYPAWEWGWISSELIDDYGNLINPRFGTWEWAAALLFYLDGLHNIG